MTHEEKQKFLHNVRTTIKTNPELLNETIMACTSGMNDHTIQLQRQVADFETIAVGFMSMANKRYDKKIDLWATNLVLSKLKKHKNHCYINWTSDIQELEEKLKD